MENKQGSITQRRSKQEKTAANYKKYSTIKGSIDDINLLFRNASKYESPEKCIKEALRLFESNLRSYEE